MITDDLTAALLDPSAYPLRPDSVRLVQTHISYVFLAGNEVFKVKKPVQFSFLDFSTLERRRHFCEEEVRLNRRLAAEVYLDVIPITRDGAAYRVGGDGEIVDYAVHMRRLPDDRFLRELVVRREAGTELMKRIARKMATFHAADASEPTIDLGDPVDELARRVRDNFTGLGPHAPDIASSPSSDTLHRLLTSAISRSANELRSRQRLGRVRDCHGDLRPDHVCCTDELPIFDCIEFSPRIRHCDVASEMAFLAVELEFLDAAPLADALIHAYVAATNDDGLRRVLPLFKAYRAQVRALVSALTSGEAEIPVDVRARMRAEAGRYLALAERHAWSAHAPVLIAIAGRSGSGKSTLAARLADRSGYGWIRSDVVRKRLAGLAPLDRPSDAAVAGRLYSAERTRELYSTLASEAEILLTGGGAIVDATFQRRRNREAFQSLAARLEVPILWIECRADDATVRTRLTARTQRGDDPSDATWEIAQTQTREFEALDEVSPSHRLELRTDRNSEALVYEWLVERITRPYD